jgi:hypothetical protein
MKTANHNLDRIRTTNPRFPRRGRGWTRPASIITLGVFGVTLAAGGIAVAKSKSDHDQAKVLETVSQESAAAVRDMRAARLAIFDGHPGDAKRLLASARKSLSAAKKQRPQTLITVKTEHKVGNKTVSKNETRETTDLVPVDAWLGVSEDFVSTPEKDASIEKANAHLKAGDHKEALEELHAVDVDVLATRVLMPMDSTSKHLDKAITLLNKDKYYEANLALMAAENGMMTDTVLLQEPVDHSKTARNSHVNTEGRNRHGHQ